MKDFSEAPGSCWNYFIFLVILLTIFRRSKFLRFYSNYVVIVILAVAAAFLALPFLLATPRKVGNSRYLHLFMKHIPWLMGAKLELRNREILNEERGAVIVTNHQSIFDILFGGVQIQHEARKIIVICKKALLYFGPISLAFWLVGCVFIDRLSPAKAHEQLKEASFKMNSQKVKLWICPEGTRNKTGSGLLPFKRGAFIIAITCQVPIIPFVFAPYYFIDRAKLVFNSGKCIMQALPPITTTGLSLDDVEDLMERTRNVMVEEYEKLSEEVGLLKQ